MTSDDSGFDPVPAAGPATTPGTGAWRQAHWAFIAIGALRNLRGWIVPLAFVLLTQGLRGSRSDLIWYGIAAIATLFAVGTSLAEWWMYRYRLSDRDITLKSGLVSKQERVIPFERIQAVNLAEAPLERLFGVVRLEIDTGAGGSQESEIALQAITHDEATALRAHLLAARQRLRGEAPEATAPTGDAAASPVGEGTLIRKLTTRELLVAGATSGRIGAAAAIAGVLLQFGEELVPRNIWNRVPWEDAANAATSIQVIASIVVTLGVLAWLISIAATALTYGGFELRREGDQLLVQYGLLDRRRVTIPIRRIQAIRIVETPLRQPFGYAEVRFDLAGLGAEEGSRGVLSPLLPRREVDALLEAACPAFAFDPGTRPIRTLPARARRRYLVAASVGWVIFILLAAVVAWRLPDVAMWWVLPGLLLTPVFAALGNLRYRDAGWLLNGQEFALRWRAISRVTVLTQVRRLQYRELRADPFQRRARLATFQAAVASGGLRQGFSLPHLDARDAESLVQALGRTPRHS